MKELDERQKAFIDLWKSGHRFLTEEDMKNRNHGMYKEEAGFYEGMTIEGMKYLAKRWSDCRRFEIHWGRIRNIL